MKMPRITRKALNDAQKAMDDFIAKNPVLGNQFADALADAFHLIATKPRQSARLETNSTTQEVRRVILFRFNYLVVYKIVGDDPLVLAVMHASQAPDCWLHGGTEG